MINRHKISTPSYKEFTSAVDAKKFLKNSSFPLVIKADGLAAGKGVVICQKLSEGLLALGEILSKKKFGNAGKKIIIEEFIEGFEISIKRSEYDIENKKVLILGGGGVVPSIIYALKKMNVSKILVSNRTKNKALNLKKLFNNLHIVDWGEIPNFDVVINATRVGLKKEDVLDLKFSETLTNKFFYDVIYNPVETNFLKIGKKNGNLTMNGKMMFIYQASAAFKVWHGIEPQIDSNILKLLEND